MRTARLLTVSHCMSCISGWAGSVQPPLLDADPPPDADHPLDADPLVMWPVLHAGKPTPPPNPCEQNDTQV